MFIKEEILFNYLTWICHALSGVIISVFLGEHFYGEQDINVIISTCAKFPNDEFSLHMAVIALLIFYFVGLVIQAAIFLKQKHLEEELQCGLWVVHYDNGKLKYVKNNLDAVNHKLSKHKRNVISPLGSLLSHVMGAVYATLFTCTIFNIDPSGPPIIGQFLVFSVHGVYFFLLNFLETVCSPTLRGSMIPRLRHEYHVNV